MSRKAYPAFIKADDKLIAVDTVTWLDLENLEAGQVVVHHLDGTGLHKSKVTGFFAIEAVMILKPSALEGRRLQWPKHAWVVHNLVGHPVMQLLAFMGALTHYKPFYTWAMWVHDATTPSPSGFKSRE